MAAPRSSLCAAPCAAGGLRELAAPQSGVTRRNIYLSLSDAIALAIENNLDVELQRYNMPTADSELLRAKGGGLLRGFSYNLAEAPVGVGGPSSPLVTTAASSTLAAGSVPTNPSELGVLAEQQTNLSVLGTIPLSNGPPIPQFDPAITGQVNWLHQSLPDQSCSRRQRCVSHQHYIGQYWLLTRLRTRHTTRSQLRQFA